MQEMSISRFKEQCLALIDNLGPEGILVTKHGKAVARVVPADSDCAVLIGSLAGKVKIKGDVLSTGTGWNAES